MEYDNKTSILMLLDFTLYNSQNFKALTDYFTLTGPSDRNFIIPF